ncbi:MAG: rhomboid family intramembrane serine protease [Acidimicrobiales bacterium]
MIPLKDYNPTRQFAIITALLLAANIGVYLFVQRPGTTDQTAFSFTYAAIPCEIVTGEPLSSVELAETLRGNNPEACVDDSVTADSSPSPLEGKSVYLAILYSMFLHGGLLHLGGNMLYLWVFGNNIEDRMGVGAYVAFYLASGLVATIAHIAVQPASTVPVVGASGAVAGVMGAYLVLFPRVQIRTALIFILILLRDIPAVWLLAFWFVSQFFTNPNEGVAWVAHVGGFAFGALVAAVFRSRLIGPRVSPEYL